VRDCALGRFPGSGLPGGSRGASGTHSPLGIVRLTRLSGMSPGVVGECLQLNSGAEFFDALTRDGDYPSRSPSSTAPRLRRFATIGDGV